MLQQTQTSRVVEPWTQFPASASRRRRTAPKLRSPTVLRAWSGLGYHRRAKALHDAARVIRDEYDGDVPRDVATAAPTARRRRVHGERRGVLRLRRARRRARHQRRARARARPRQPHPRVGRSARTLAHGARAASSPPRSTRRCLTLAHSSAERRRAATLVRVARPVPVAPPRRSRPRTHSAGVSRPQSPFEGSDRQARGRVLQRLREGPRSRRRIGERLVGVEPGRCDEALDALVHDGLVTQIGQRYSLRE